MHFVSIENSKTLNKYYMYSTCVFIDWEGQYMWLIIVQVIDCKFITAHVHIDKEPYMY